MFSKLVLLSFFVAAAFCSLPCQFNGNDYDYDFSNFGSLRSWFVASSATLARTWFFPVCADALDDMKGIPCKNGGACYLDLTTAQIVEVGALNHSNWHFPTMAVVSHFSSEEYKASCGAMNSGLRVEYTCTPARGVVQGPVVVRDQECNAVVNIKSVHACGVYNPNNGNSNAGNDSDSSNVTVVIDNEIWSSEISPYDVEVGVFQIIMISLMAFAAFCACLSCCICLRRRHVMKKAALAQQRQQQYNNVAFHPVPLENYGENPMQYIPTPAYLSQMQAFSYYYPSQTETQVDADEQLARQLQAKFDQEV